MVQDYPDWTLPVTQVNIAGLAGLEELAARLGSIVPWDMKGNIILLEDFESELTEWSDLSTGDCSVVRSSRHKYSGDWSAKLITAGDEGDTVQFARMLYFPGVSKYALACRLCLHDECYKIGMYAYLNRGSLLESYYFDISYNPNTGELILETRDDAAYLVATVKACYASPYYSWLPLMITFDLESEKFDKVFLGDEEYDISAHSIYLGTTSAYREIDLYVYTKRSDADFTSYIDDIVLAKNVP